MHGQTHNKRPRRYLAQGSQVKVTLELPGVIRLADKFLLVTVRADLVQRVVDEWPRDLFEWDVREGEISSLMTTAQSQPVWVPARPIAARLPEPASAIMFAQEFGCPQILPAAFYLLARISVTDEWEADTEHGYELRAAWSRLDTTNLLRYMRGCKAMVDYHRCISSEFDRGEMLCQECRPPWSLPGYIRYTGAPPVDYDDKRYGCLQYVRTLRDMAWKSCPPHELLRGFTELQKKDASDELNKTHPNGLCEDCSLYFWEWVHETRLSV
ncbi:hypothetical protein OH77DRAFT_1426574 [Trametes cingulata]|nr:hypothetical protein OH77DRAFT_1426574 [Trametes cingulata]